MPSTARLATVYLDELDGLIQTSTVAELVNEYRDVAAHYGVDTHTLATWLADDQFLDYDEAARDLGVQPDTIHQWVTDWNRAQRADRWAGYHFLPPDVNKSKARLLRRNRLLLWAWRNLRVRPGTRVAIERKPPGRSPNPRLGSEPRAA